MSDTKYEIDGVTITVHGGGYYDLTHASLAEPERVRGKEVAEARAKQIAADAAAADPNAAEFQKALQAAGFQPAVDPVEVGVLSAPEPELIPVPPAEAPAQVIITDTPPADADLEATPLKQRLAPREYTGVLPDEVKAQVGIKFRRIVLESVPDIPPTGLFLQHNGRPYMIKPDEVVDVPEFLCDVLDHAIMQAPIIDGLSQRVLGYRPRRRYPYRDVT